MCVLVEVCVCRAHECICHIHVSGVLTCRLFSLGCVGADPPSPLCYTTQRISQRVVGHRVRGSVCMGLFDWCKNVSDTVTLVCGSYLCDNNVSIVPLFVRCVCVCLNMARACRVWPLACHLRPVRGERRRVRREVAARRLICWRLCGSSACTTGGSTGRCWRSPWPPTTCGGRALLREQGRAGGPTTITTTARSSLPPLPLPPRPRPHPPLQSRRPAKMRLAPSPIPPLTDHLVRITDPSIRPQNANQMCYDFSSSFLHYRTWIDTSATFYQYFAIAIQEYFNNANKNGPSVYSSSVPEPLIYLPPNEDFLFCVSPVLWIPKLASHFYNLITQTVYNRK